MVNVGAPIAYAALAEGAPVYDPDGTRLGEVADVLADETVDIFHGLIVRLSPSSEVTGGGPTADLRFAAADQIADLGENGVRLSVDRYALLDPEVEPVAREAMEEDLGGGVPPAVQRARDWFRQRR